MYQKSVKRFLDIVLALTALILLSPVIVIVAVLVRLKLGSPVLFRQQRPGKDEKIFTLYKFRSMTDERNKNGEVLSDEVRLTKFGKALRSTSLDELPSLLNIIKGDMSIVGPRPLLIRYIEFYYEHERKRSSIKPGLTGLAQINGRNALSWDERFNYDIYYTDNVSFKLDLIIFLMTFISVVRRKNILMGSEHTLQDLDVERNRKIENILDDNEYIITDLDIKTKIEEDANDKAVV